jgi:hypothetical protein
VSKNFDDQLFIFSEVLDEEGELQLVNMHHALSGKKWRINQSKFIEIIVNGSLDDEIQKLDSLSIKCSPLENESIKLWKSRGWLWNISYFLAVKRTNFIDVGDNAKSIRIGTLKKFSDVEELPLPEYPVNTQTSIQLISTLRNEQTSVGEILRKRHSVSAPVSERLELKTLSSVLSEALYKVSKTAINLGENGSADALMSLGSGFDFYLTVYDVRNLKPGLYRIRPESMTLDLLKTGNFRHEMSQALIGQEGPKLAACTVSLVGDFERYMWRYRHERALSLLWVDAARVMSSIIWSATKHELKMQISPAVIDSVFLDFVNLPKDLSRQCLYNISLA